MTVDTIGYMAATLTTVAFIPQAYKVYKTKQTGDLSLGLFVLLNFGIFMWFVYGILIGSYPVIVANGVTMFFAGYILYSKLQGTKDEKNS